MRIYEPPFRIEEDHIPEDIVTVFNVYDAQGRIGTFGTQDDAETAVMAFGMMRYAQDKVTRATDAQLPMATDGTPKMNVSRPVMDIPWDTLLERFRRPNPHGNVYHVDNLFIGYRNGEFYIGDWSGHVTVTPDPLVLADLIRLESSGSRRQTIRSILMLSTRAEREKLYNEARAKILGQTNPPARLAFNVQPKSAKPGKDLNLEDLGL